MTDDTPHGANDGHPGGGSAPGASGPSPADGPDTSVPEAGPYPGPTPPADVAPPSVPDPPPAPPVPPSPGAWLPPAAPPGSTWGPAPAPPGTPSAAPTPAGSAPGWGASATVGPDPTGRTWAAATDPGPDVADAPAAGSWAGPGGDAGNGWAVPARRASGGDGHRGGWLRFLAAGLVGGLVGALVAGGIVVAVDDDPSAVPAGQSAVARPTQTISEPADIQQIIAKVEPAVVRIDVSSGTFGGAEGTGFLVTADGNIVTNAHVVAENGALASRIEVTLHDGTVEQGTVVGVDVSSDLAVVKVDGSNLPTVELGSSDALQVGDDVVAIGHALGLAGDPSVTTGVVSALHRSIGTQINTQLDDVIQTDAAINPGNSGGPLVNAKGQVVGINTAIADPGSSNNIGFAISIDSAKPVLDDLQQFGTFAYLGVYTEDVTAGLARARGLAVEQGAYVARVQSDTGADRAGIRAGDVIVKMDGKQVQAAADVRDVVRSHHPGDSIDIVVNRDGTETTLSVTLGKAPTGL